jgi:Secreted and surface protein containing fasciclin-like repeats
MTDSTTDHASETVGDIVAVASGNESFSTLVAAVGAAGLVETLQGAGPFTVFAPTNEAFAALPAGLVDALLLEENRETLVKILTYHVVGAKVMAADVASGDVATVEGSMLSVVVADGVKINGSSTVTATDVWPPTESSTSSTPSWSQQGWTPQHCSPKHWHHEGAGAKLSPLRHLHSQGRKCIVFQYTSLQSIQTPRGEQDDQDNASERARWRPSEDSTAPPRNTWWRGCVSARAHSPQLFATPLEHSRWQSRETEASFVLPPDTRELGSLRDNQ